MQWIYTDCLLHWYTLINKTETLVVTQHGSKAKHSNAHCYASHTLVEFLRKAVILETFIWFCNVSVDKSTTAFDHIDQEIFLVFFYLIKLYSSSESDSCLESHSLPSIAKWNSKITNIFLSWMKILKTCMKNLYSHWLYYLNALMSHYRVNAGKSNSVWLSLDSICYKKA